MNKYLRLHRQMKRTPCPDQIKAAYTAVMWQLYGMAYASSDADLEAMKPRLAELMAKLETARTGTGIT